jgi:nucleoid-associated protein YgaU
LVVTRQRKLLAAGLVLAAGFGLAWPLRRTQPLKPASLQHAPVAANVQTLARPVELALQTSPKPLVAARAAAPNAMPPRHSAPDPFADVPRPIYSTISDGPDVPTSTIEPKLVERIHVVHQGDSLDRLAKRYLGNEARALEIFDLNRESLDNPHILPIGVELRLPPATADGRVDKQ